MIDAARMIARHLPNVLTYFTHRISNAVAEGLNSKVATVQKRACGYRNQEHFKIAVYFNCGGLDLLSPAQELEMGAAGIEPEPTDHTHVPVRAEPPVVTVSSAPGDMTCIETGSSPVSVSTRSSLVDATRFLARTAESNVAPGRAL